MRFFLIAILVLITSLIKAQTPNMEVELKKDRSLLIVTSVDKNIPKNLESEVQQMDSLISIISQQNYVAPDLLTQSPEYQTLDKNYKEMILYSNEFIKSINVFNFSSFEISRYLQNIYSGYGYTNFKVYPLNLELLKADNEELNKIAKEYNAKFIFVIYALELSNAAERKATIKAKLYDSKSKKIIFDKAFEGDSKNTGGYFMCEDGSLNCCINNATQNLFHLLLQKVD